MTRNATLDEPGNTGALDRITIATVAFFALLFSQNTFAQRSWIAVCPLSEGQQQASIDAFSRIVPTLTREPRCVNCHGGLDPSTASTHPSVDLPTAAGRGDDCTFCHDNMVKRTNGQISVWHLAPKFLEFVNKTDGQLCEQIKGSAEGPCANGICDPWPLAEKFIAHLTDDEGRDNFTATAFAGTRGLSDVPPKLPAITHAQLLAIGNAWTGVTDGEWQGSRDCGCAPTHYALRISAVTVITGANFRADMPPVDIPIEFEDDGTFKGDSAIRIDGRDSSSDCVVSGGLTTRLVAEGKAVQTWRERYLDVKIRSGGPATTQASGRCPEGTVSRSFTGTSDEVWEIRLEGTVGEIKEFPVKTPDPAVRTTARIEIVKVE